MEIEKKRREDDIVSVKFSEIGRGRAIVIELEMVLLFHPMNRTNQREEEKKSSSRRNERIRRRR